MGITPLLLQWVSDTVTSVSFGWFVPWLWMFSSHTCTDQPSCLLDGNSLQISGFFFSLCANLLLILKPMNFNCLVLLGFQLCLLSSGGAPSSASVPPSCSVAWLLAQGCNWATGWFMSLFSHLSGVAALHCLMSNVLKLSLIISGRQASLVPASPYCLEVEVFPGLWLLLKTFLHFSYFILTLPLSCEVFLTLTLGIRKLRAGEKKWLSECYEESQWQEREVWMFLAFYYTFCTDCSNSWLLCSALLAHSLMKK